MHVTVGTLFLIFCLVRQVVLNVPHASLSNLDCGFTSQQHLGFEAAA